MVTMKPGKTGGVVDKMTMARIMEGKTMAAPRLLRNKSPGPKFDSAEESGKP
jgi:hypothetical protein